jgi:hypothetical protein
MTAKLLSTAGPWLEAVIEIDGETYSVMDEFSMDDRPAPSLGSCFEVEFSAFMDGDDSWDSMFSSNPECLRCLLPSEGWSYRAYGCIVSISPVVVDCGLLLVPDVLHTSDPRVIGEFISFAISRLDASMTCHQQAT